MLYTTQRYQDATGKVPYTEWIKSFVKKILVLQQKLISALTAQKAAILAIISLNWMVFGSLELIMAPVIVSITPLMVKE